MSGLHLARRGLLAGLGLSVAPLPAVAPFYVESPDDRLAACLGRVWLLEQDLERMPPMSAEEDDAATGAILDRIDDVVRQAASIRPETARGFGYKARIVQLHGMSYAGEAVQRSLLAELIELGGVGI